MSNKQLSVITGASRGIGRAIALALAEEGHNTVIFGRDPKSLNETAELIKNKKVEVFSFAGDVRDVDFVNNSINETLANSGRIDNLVNNAGFGIFKNFMDSSLQEFRDQIDVNLFGVYNFTKAVVPSMIKAKKGNIINISSLAGKNSFIGGTMYSASKFALMGFSRSLMLELREHFIKVILICPGSVDTEFFVESGHTAPSKGKTLLPEDIAHTVVSVIRLPERAMISEVDIRPTNPK